MGGTLPTKWHREYTETEESLHVWTHGFGVVLAVAGLISLLVAGMGTTPLQMGTSALYGATLVVLYFASTFYHQTKEPELRLKRRVFDQAAIYLFIAGTYTPFSLVVLGGTWGWIILGLVWGFGALGIAKTFLFKQRFVPLTVIAYLAMGWTALIAIKPLWDALPFSGFAWIVGGGLLYTIGAMFYLWKKLPYHHAIWHVFVLGASACHFVAVHNYAM